MRSRKGHGLGSVYQRGNGQWVGALDAGFEDGRRKRKWLYGSTERQVIEKLNAARREMEDGLSIGGREQPLEKYVAGWLAQRDPRTPSSGVRQLGWNTWDGYERRLRKHVLPVIGAMQLGQIRPDHIRRVLAKMAASNLSATSVACVRDTLATVLERAVKDRVLPHNPVKAVDSVKRSKARRYTLTVAQASAFLRAAEGDPLEALFVVTLHAGLRESEVLGLHWEDVNLERAELTVRRALMRVRGSGLQTGNPKTAASAATIPLTARAVAALRAHRDRLTAQNRIPAGYVFSTGLGTAISASNMLRSNFFPICERAGIPTRLQPDGSYGLRFHDLRHSAGSLLIQQGVRPKDVQAILRHSRVSTTMDLYVHSYDEDLKAAVAKLGAATG